MIAWETATRCAASVLGARESLAWALKERIDGGRPFRNTDYPLSPLPLLLARDDTERVVPALQRYVGLLGKIIGLFRADAEVRRWYGLGPAAEALIAADVHYRDTVPVCRLDGYLEQGTERLRLLENNADAPAGTLFSPRINRLVAESLEQAGIPAPAWCPPTFRDETALLDVLLDVLREPGRSPRVAVLQFAGEASVECRQMVEAYRRTGIEAFIADPRELEADGDRVRFGGRTADACWNKVNTVAWRKRVEPDTALVARWVKALGSGALLHINPFGARYVAESKLTLALTRDPRFTDRFTTREHALIEELLPWGARLGPDALGPDGRTNLPADVLERQHEYVIKEAYDIRGDGVTVGAGVDRGTWRRAVAWAVRNGAVVQRRVRPTAYPVARTDRSPPLVAMPTTCDAFVFGGRVTGFGAKAGHAHRLNVFQGGQKLAVHVVADS